MESPWVFCLLGMVVFILVPLPGFTQNPDDIHLLLKVVIDTQLNVIQKLEDIQGRLANLEEQTSTISSAQRCWEESREEMASFRNMLGINECKDNSHNCSEFATCTDQIVYYGCTCLPGYSGDGFTCLDIDECRENSLPCGDGQKCTNTPGSYLCTCQDGLQMENDICQDINECELGLHTCDTGATCTNTIGSYTCKCKWHANGDTCKEPHCQWPYRLIQGVGCIYFVTVEMTWEQAKTNCEAGFKGILYEPTSTEEFMNLINHFNETGMVDFIWVGVKGGKWIYSGEAVASELWRQGDPNEGDIGFGYLRKASSYKLGDFSIERSWPSVCKQR